MLEIKNLNFGFGDKLLYKDFNLTLEDQKVYGILGRNGAGKTTLFRILYGWFKSSSATINWKGNPLTKQDISYLETDPYFYPYMTGQEYLNLIGSNNDVKQLSNLAMILNLPLQNIVDSYSTGMKKKLAFIGVQSQNKSIQLLDEPFNGVDLESNEILKKLILKNKLTKLTILSSHIMNTLLDTCDLIIYLDGINYKLFEKTDFNELEILVKNSINEKFNDLK